jgi:hypothetical protein
MNTLDNKIAHDIDAPVPPASAVPMTSSGGGGWRISCGCINRGSGRADSPDFDGEKTSALVGRLVEIHEWTGEDDRGRPYHKVSATLKTSTGNEWVAVSMSSKTASNTFMEGLLEIALYELVRISARSGSTKGSDYDITYANWDRVDPVTNKPTPIKVPRSQTSERYDAAAAQERHLEQLRTHPAYRGVPDKVREKQEDAQFEEPRQATATLLAQLKARIRERKLWPAIEDREPTYLLMARKWHERVVGGGDAPKWQRMEDLPQLVVQGLIDGHEKSTSIPKIFDEYDPFAE